MRFFFVFLTFAQLTVSAWGLPDRCESLFLSATQLAAQQLARLRAEIRKIEKPNEKVLAIKEFDLKYEEFERGAGDAFAARQLFQDALKKHDREQLQTEIENKKKEMQTAQTADVELTALRRWTQFDEIETDFPRGMSTLAIDPLGTKAIAGTRSGEVRIFDLHELKEIPTAYKNDYWVEKAVVSPDGKIAATLSQNGEVKIMDLQSATEITSYRHDQLAFSAVFSPDSQRLITVSTSGELKMLDLQTRAFIPMPPANEKGYRALITKDGSKLITAGDRGAVRLFDLQRSPIEALVIPALSLKKDITQIILSPDNKTLCLIEEGKGPHLFEFPSLKRIRRPLELLKKGVYHAEFSPDGKYLAVTGYNGLRLLDLVTRKLIPLNYPYNGLVNHLKFAPDSSFLVSSDLSNQLKMLDLQTLTEVPISSKVFSWIVDIQILPDGSKILVGTENKSLLILNRDADLKKRPQP